MSADRCGTVGGYRGYRGNPLPAPELPPVATHERAMRDAEPIPHPIVPFVGLALTLVGVCAVVLLIVK